MTPEEIDTVARRAGREGAREALALLGFDAQNPAEVRADQAHLRRWRKSVEEVERIGWGTVTATIVAGALAAFWLGLKEIFYR
jgi:hypothetical protein